jgi:hypothetical protein
MVSKAAMGLSSIANMGRRRFDLLLAGRNFLLSSWWDRCNMSSTTKSFYLYHHRIGGFVEDTLLIRCCCCSDRRICGG